MQCLACITTRGSQQHQALTVPQLCPIRHNSIRGALPSISAIVHWKINQRKSRFWCAVQDQLEEGQVDDLRVQPSCPPSKRARSSQWLRVMTILTRYFILGEAQDNNSRASPVALPICRRHTGYPSLWGGRSGDRSRGGLSPAQHQRRFMFKPPWNWRRPRR